MRIIVLGDVGRRARVNLPCPPTFDRNHQHTDHPAGMHHHVSGRAMPAAALGWEVLPIVGSHQHCISHLAQSLGTLLHVPASHGRHGGRPAGLQGRGRRRPLQGILMCSAPRTNHSRPAEGIPSSARPPLPSLGLVAPVPPVPRWRCFTTGRCSRLHLCAPRTRRRWCATPLQVSPPASGSPATITSRATGHLLQCTGRCIQGDLFSQQICASRTERLNCAMR